MSLPCNLCGCVLNSGVFANKMCAGFNTEPSRSTLQPKRSANVLLWFCVLAILAGVSAFYFGNRPPRGESELAIWNAIQRDERIIGVDSQPVTIVRWHRGRLSGDLAPTDMIIVSTKRGKLRVNASAYCDEEGWKASIGTVLPID